MGMGDPAAPVFRGDVFLSVTFPMDVMAGRLPIGSEQSRAQEIREGAAHSPFILRVTARRQQVTRGLGR
jgi:hypothetical protein